MLDKKVSSEFNKLYSVPGLEIQSRPEWTDVRFGKDYMLSFSLIGKSILLLQVSGHATLLEVKKSLLFFDDIIREVIPEDQDFLMVENLSNIESVSREARKYFIDYLLKQERLQGLIFYGVSPLQKLSISLGRRRNIVRFYVDTANNYIDAIKCAQKILSINRTDILPPSTLVSPKEKGSYNVITKPDWQLHDENFSLRFEVIDNILHGVSTGRLEKEHIDPCIEIQEKIIKTMGFHRKPYFYILGLENSKGTSQKARRVYVNAMMKLHKVYPFDSVIFYGANRLLQAGIRLAKPFMLFNVHTTNNLEDALLALKSSNTFKKNIPAFIYKKKHSHLSFTHKSEQNVNQLLQYIGKINWDIDGNQESSGSEPSHPYSSVFDAIDLIKWELDDLLKEHKQVEVELRDAKDAAEASSIAKSEFLANMSHELRTPLNHIIGFTELVMGNNYGDLNADQKEYLGYSLQSSKHLLSLINDILDLSKIEANKMDLETSDINLMLLLENSMKIIEGKAMKQGIQLSLNSKHIPEIVTVDERKIKQILYNLLSNAVKFTPEGGNIQLTAELIYVRMKHGLGQIQSDLNYEQKGSQKFIRISVADTGIGLAREDCERIFTPFEQVENTTIRRFHGTGLGLALTRRFVHLHGGEVFVHSEGKNKGSTFSFTIPYSSKS